MNSLTPREKEVAELLYRGYTDPEIAKELVISVRTVNAHRYNIYGKLNIRYRRELFEYVSSKKSKTFIVVPSELLNKSTTIMIGEL